MDVPFWPDYFEDPNKLALLRKYGEESFISESIEFLNKLYIMKKEMRETIVSMWNQFINPIGATPINVSGEVVEEFQDIACVAPNNFVLISKTVLDEAQAQIEKLLAQHVSMFQKWMAEEREKERDTPASPKPVKSGKRGVKDARSSSDTIPFRKSGRKTKVLSGSDFPSPEAYVPSQALDLAGDQLTGSPRKSIKKDKDESAKLSRFLKAELAASPSAPSRTIGKKRTYFNLHLSVHEVQATHPIGPLYMVLYNGYTPVAQSTIEDTGTDIVFSWTNQLDVDGVESLSLALHEHESGNVCLGYCHVRVPMNTTANYYRLPFLKNNGRDYILNSTIEKNQQDGAGWLIKVNCLEGLPKARNYYITIDYEQTQFKSPLFMGDNASKLGPLKVHGDDCSLAIISVFDSSDVLCGQSRFYIQDLPSKIGQYKWILSGGPLGVTVNLSCWLTAFVVDDDTAYQDLLRFLMEDNFKFLKELSGAYISTPRNEIVVALFDNERKLFKQYLSKHVCSENLDAYLATINFTTIFDQSKRVKEATRIWDRFLREGAPDEVGTISSSIRASIKDAMGQADFNVFQPLNSATFNAMWNLWQSYLESPEHAEAKGRPIGRRGPCELDSGYQLATRIIDCLETHRFEPSLVKALIDAEVMGTDSPSTLLCTSSSLRFKIIESYFYKALIPIVKAALVPVLTAFLTQKQSTDMPRAIQASAKVLQKNLIESSQQTPMVLRNIFAYFKSRVEEKWPSEKNETNRLASFLLGRLICSSIEHPASSGMLPGYPSPKQSEVLAVMGTAFRMLFELPLCQPLPPAFDKIIGGWLTKTKTSFLNEFLEEIGTPRNKIDEIPKPIGQNTFGKAVHSLLTFVNANKVELKALPATLQPDIKRLVDLTTQLATQTALSTLPKQNRKTGTLSHNTFVPPKT